jgi:hypothetical protein
MPATRWSSFSRNTAVAGVGGVEVESKTAVLFELRDGLVIRMQGFMDQADALRAAGLAE